MDYLCLSIMKRIVLITGGQSSGKSLHAERLALELSPAPVYVATARAAEMEDCVERHRARRGPEWTTVEEPLRLGRLAFGGRVVLVDCVTVWLANMMFEATSGGTDAGDGAPEASPGIEAVPDLDALEAAAWDEIERFTAPDATYIFVTNEVGLGGTAANALARSFADLQGRLNQRIAAVADEVTMVVSGIPIKIKQ
jgi:adenosylcobinamide kinase/adenosylcobinamide-phosphate guanylyltransferase